MALFAGFALAAVAGFSAVVFLATGSGCALIVSGFDARAREDFAGAAPFAAGDLAGFFAGAVFVSSAFAAALAVVFDDFVSAVAPGFPVADFFSETGLDAALGFVARTGEAFADAAFFTAGDLAGFSAAIAFVSPAFGAGLGVVFDDFAFWPAAVFFAAPSGVLPVVFAIPCLPYVYPLIMFLTTSQPDVAACKTCRLKYPVLHLL